VQWVRSLGLEGLLAKHLPLGSFADPLGGIKKMSEEELGVVLSRFTEAVPAAVSAGLKKLKGRADTSFQVGSEVEEHINSKFALDGAFVGRFATLNDFYKGPEELIGTPNPKIQQGMEGEHCRRGNCKVEFTTNNYNVTTTPTLEWEFVVEPKVGFAYPHTPKDKKLWPNGKGWKGESGREPLDLIVFTVKSEVKLAGLTDPEVIAARLYTGPMFMLYNAGLRGFPDKDVKSLKGKDGKENRYETTIFAIASAITKLSKVTAVPTNRLLYRGLGGMILPRQFWELYPECQVTFTVTVTKGSAADILEKLKGTANDMTSANAFDLSTKYLLLELGAEIGEARSPVGVRVVKEAKQEGELVRMSVALPISKGYFKENLETYFHETVKKFCGDGHSVQIEEVADKPKDFRGGGALMSLDTQHPLIRACAIPICTLTFRLEIIHLVMCKLLDPC
jgi:hypothetical protein